MALQPTLHKEIGLKLVTEKGLSFLGMRTTKVIPHDLGRLEVKKKSKIALKRVSPITSSKTHKSPQLNLPDQDFFHKTSI